MSSTEVIPLEGIQTRILVLRSQRVLLDADLARIYGVPTKRLNEQVKRNTRRFPEDFVFQLTVEEKTEVVAKCDHLRNLRFAKSLPYAFTEHGAIQAANVLNSDAAVDMGVHVVRAFVGLRQLFVGHKALSAKLDELDRRVGEHDGQLADVVKAIRLLVAPPGPKHGRKIGFHRGNR